MTKTLVFLALSLVIGSASAATYYPSKEGCVEALESGKSVGYKPTGKARKFGDDRIIGLELRNLEADACVKMDTMKGVKWVVLTQGTKVYTDAADVKMHGDCQNTIYEVVYGKQPDTPSSSATTNQPKAASAALERGSCTTNDCNTVTEVQVINQVVIRHGVCQDEVTGPTFAPTNGQCNFKPIQANVQMAASSSVTCVNCTGNQSVAAAPAPAVTAAAPAADCVDCKPQLTLTGKVSRTDGRCVVKVIFKGAEKFVRLSPENGTGRLMAAVVDNERADFNRSNPIAYVGADNAFLHANPTCEAAVRGFSSERSYAPTVRRLKMEGCTFAGKV